jgi:hypothetical protein
VSNEINNPLFVFGVSFLVLWLTARVGSSVLRTRRGLDEGAREEFGVIQASTLTLLGLLMGFSFSMASTRYDQRKNFEEQEANAIGTEFVRAGLLPPADATTVRALLRNYLDQRVSFYLTRDEPHLRQIHAQTAQLQNDLWSAVQAPGTAHPSPVLALAVSGMNDVFNSQGFTQAAWWNRIPTAAWALMVSIAICGNLLVGYGVRGTKGGGNLLLILPLVLAIAFSLIADIDSPRGGLIHVYPHNLQSLSASLPAHPTEQQP